MNYKSLHRWNLTPRKAIELQNKLKERIILKKITLNKVKLIAGVDVSVKDDLSKAAIVVLSYPNLEIIETASSIVKTSFPYIPGLLSFREGPVILKCIKKLTSNMDLFIFDGQGMTHPRRIGIASHIGIILNKPSIGSAKSHLYGMYKDPGMKKGDYSIIKDKDGTSLGAVLHSRDDTKPIYVSPGHLTDIPSSVKIVLSCCLKYKLPEPIRAAHHAASLVP